MTGNRRIARVRGIEISVNWTWLLVVALITWSLADQVFPEQNPGLAGAVYVAMALIAALLFFSSLLAHELGHALRAVREGLEIEGITLWLLGGVARFKDPFPNAGAELRIALAGPAVSLVLGVLFTLVAATGQLPSAVDGVVAWLGYVNLALLVFNLLPALPLDGGRVLRALLWRAKGDFAWATNAAVAVGRGFAYLFVGGGLLLFVAQGAFGGAWLALIGWFLLHALRAESQYAALQQALAGLRVGDLMSPDPVTAPADCTLGEFVDEIAPGHRFTTFPVVDDAGVVLGLLAFKSVLEVPRDDWDAITVRERLIPVDVAPRLHAGDTALGALTTLLSSATHRALVFDDEKLIGLLSISDLARALDGPAGPAAARPGPTRTETPFAARSRARG